MEIRTITVGARHPQIVIAYRVLVLQQQTMVSAATAASLAAQSAQLPENVRTLYHSSQQTLSKTRLWNQITLFNLF